nr:hypothetical protein [Tanacetum cinerariifolium]
MKGSDIGIQEKKAKLFNEWEMFTSNEGESIESYYHRFLKLMNDLKRNKHFPEKIASNLKFLNNLQPNGNGNLLAARAEGNATGHNGNQIRCYNCRGVGHFARNCTFRLRRRDAAYLQTQLLIAQKEEAGIQLQSEEFDLMAAAADLDEIEEVNANCILMANLQQASTSGNQTDKALVYDSDGSAEVHNYENCFDDEIFNMFTQEEQYTELLEPIHELHQKMALGYQNPFYLKQAQKKQQSLYDGKVFLEKHDPPVVHDSEEILQLAQESRQKMKPLNKEIKPANYTKINHLSRVFVSQTAKSRKELYFLNASKTANVSTSISIPDEEFSDDITPSVARKFLNEEATKFVGDFKSLAKKADESLAKYKALELEIERLLRAVVLNYAKENAYLKTTYKNLFDSISVSCTQTKTIIASLQNELQNMIYENAKLRAGTSTNTKFAKQSILGKPLMLGETHALSKPVTSNSIPTPQESKVVKNDKVIAPGMFKINPFKTSREEKHVPNNVRASVGTKSITISQPPVITKKFVNSDSNGLSSTGVDNT